MLRRPWHIPTAFTLTTLCSAAIGHAQTADQPTPPESQNTPLSGTTNTDPNAPKRVVLPINTAPRESQSDKDRRAQALGLGGVLDDTGQRRGPNGVLLLPIEQAASDTDPLRTGLRRPNVDLRAVTSFERVFQMELDPKVFGHTAAQTGPNGGAMYARMNGAVTAIFPRGQYVATQAGEAPVVPAGTVYVIGDSLSAVYPRLRFNPEVTPAPDATNRAVSSAVTSSVEPVDRRADASLPTNAALLSVHEPAKTSKHTDAISAIAPTTQNQDPSMPGLTRRVEITSDIPRPIRPGDSERLWRSKWTDAKRATVVANLLDEALHAPAPTQPQPDSQQKP